MQQIPEYLLFKMKLIAIVDARLDAAEKKNFITITSKIIKLMSF